MLNIRNVAIIAHVDHGKTTLVDQMLRQSGMFRESELRGERILDSNALEQERGITILAKNIAINYAGTKINLIDTPGHADFGGEVERVLKMADGVLLLVDAFEGPMPQTRFVLKKAFDYHLRAIVVINKIDRPDARPNEVLNEVFDLFVDLNAKDELLDFPTVYASAKHGFAAASPDERPGNVKYLFDTIMEFVPAPKDDATKPVQMLVTTLDHSSYLGRIGIGRVFAGVLRSGDKVTVIKRDGHHTTETVKQLFAFDGLSRREVQEVAAGDVCAVVGISDIHIGDTLACLDDPQPLPIITVEEPTLHMTFRINDSPFAGRSGTYLTSRHLRDRLEKELESNVALRVEPGATADEFHVSGRGLLHLGILIENMRREGYELTVGKPKVIFRELDGHKTEPIELLSIDVPAGSVGAVMELLGTRRADCRKMETRGSYTHMEFTIPSRALIGLRTRLMNATAGEAIMHHNFYEYEYLRGSVPQRNVGVMLSHETGQVTPYALDALADRGAMFVGPGEQVYEGQIVGEHCKEGDIVINVCREKKLTNIRAASADKTVVLKPPRQMSLELALEYIADDEMVEVTPAAIRLRKRMLKEVDRKRAARRA